MAETKKKNTGSLPLGTILRNGQYQYRIGEVLGQGNYGITYKASAMVKIGNISKLMTFAVKENFAKDYCSRKADGVTLRYAEEHAEEAERDLREFIAEGKTLERICHGHENIVNVNETFEENNTAYYVMEFIEGGDLQSLVRSKGRLTETEAISIISPIIDAVAHIHRNRRLHLDIKPENIVLKKDGTPILIDFGITLHFNTDGSRSGTSKDKSGGFSKGYAPLEQYAGVNRFAPEIDVYALGATLYYMLVGNDPDKAGDITAKKINSNLPENISQQTRKAILHAMNRIAEDRTQTAEEFLEELKKVTRKNDFYKLTIKHNSNGRVIGNNKTLKNGSTYQVKNNSSKTLSIIPDDGHEIEYVKLNNIDVSYQLSGNTLNLTQQKDDVTLTVRFAEKSEPDSGITHKYKKERVKDDQRPNIEGNSKSVIRRSNYNYKKIAGVSLSCILGLFVASLVSKPVANMFSTNSEMNSLEVANSMSVDGFPIYDDATGRVIFKYTGTLVNGQPEGKGTAIYSDGEWESYSGNWKNGKRSGQHCVLKYKNGDEFSGSFSDDHMALGSFHSKSSQSTFIGTFMDNKPYNGSWTTATGEQIVINEGHKN